MRTEIPTGDLGTCPGCEDYKQIIRRNSYNGSLFVGCEGFFPTNCRYTENFWNFNGRKIREGNPQRLAPERHRAYGPNWWRAGKAIGLAYDEADRRSFWIAVALGTLSVVAIYQSFGIIAACVSAFIYWKTLF